MSDRVAWMQLPIAMRPAVMPTLRGEANKAAKLTTEQVIEMRARFAAGEIPRDMASDYDVTPATVWDICRRRRWKHI